MRFGAQVPFQRGFGGRGTIHQVSAILIEVYALRLASEKPWTKKLWIYDFRTNERFTLKTNSLSPAVPAYFQLLTVALQPMSASKVTSVVS